MPKLFLKLFDRFICFLRRGSVIKNLPAYAEDMCSIPRLGRFSGEENGNPLQYSCLENPIDRSLAGYSPRGRKESNTTQQLKNNTGLDTVKGYTDICQQVHILQKLQTQLRKKKHNKTVLIGHTRRMFKKQLIKDFKI